MTNIAETVKIHPTATVDEGAIIGDGTKIWHYTHIETHTEIGQNCSFGQNVYVARHVKIGNGCRIQNNVSIYQGVELADGVFCGPSMVFTNVLTPRARFPVGEKAYLKTYVGQDASIGANATVVCGHDIGEGAMVGAGAVITQEVKPYTLVTGVPARMAGYICRCGKILHSGGPLPTGEQLICPSCSTSYKVLIQGGLERKE